KIGSAGPFVRELQANLNRLGHGPLTADGHFGAQTETAVKAFQTRHGLTVDGWAGPRTLSAIVEALKARQAAPKIDAAETDVKRKTGWWQSVTGFIGACAAWGGWLFGMQLQTVAVIAGASVLILILIVLLRRQIIAAVQDVRQAVEGG